MTEQNKPALLPFRLEKQYREYVWGGSKLRPDHVPTAEAWAIYETNRVIDGEFCGKTLADVAAEIGADFLGTKVTSRTGKRFPVLIKILDCNQWLSLQVHPDDRQAVEMEGAGQFGKTEAWYFLETDPQAEILCGVKSGVTGDEIEKGVRQGTILNATNRVKVAAGDHVLIPAGTIHALGPGMLVYEVQQSSDITYRVYDWDRPASQGRVLHIEQSIRVINPKLQVQVKSSGNVPGVTGLLACEYFTLDKVKSEQDFVHLEMDGSTFHALTVINGIAVIHGEGWSFSLQPYDSLLVPACTGSYAIDRTPGCEILRVTA